MSKRAFHATNYTPTPQADTTALTSGTYQSIRAAATSLIQVVEIMIEGLAGSSNPMIMQMARASTLSSSATALASPNSDGFMNPLASTITTLPVTLVAATVSGPQRSAVTTDAKLDLNINAFGGIVRWQAAPGEEWYIFGASTVAASAGESVLSQFTGGSSATISSHLIYEIM